MLDTFSPIEPAVTLMSGFDRPWAIAGGWAIDLYLGHVTRVHKDVDIMVFRADQLRLQRHFAGWHLYTAHGGAFTPWQEGEYLRMPFHTIWAYRPGNPPPHSPDMQSDLEFLLDDLSPPGDEWQFRREPSITLPFDKVIIWTYTGVPYLAPEIALLYKAREYRAEDDTDFDNALGLLEEERRGWLAKALGVCLPGHAWLARL